MTTRHTARSRCKHLAALHRFENLEKRVLLNALLDPLSQPRFVNPLPVPGVLQPTVPGGSHYEVSITQFEQNLGLFDPDTGDPLLTTVWGYNGTYPGGTIEARVDMPVTVRWTNDLVDSSNVPLPHLLPVDTTVHWADPLNYPASGVPVVTHLHEGHTESASDGLPDQWFTPGFAQIGKEWVHETFNYDNDQEASTMWYHDHALGITRLNVYAGLAGFYLLRDAHELSLNLPSGQFEIPIAIQDRMFTEDGQLFYPSTPEEPGQPDPSVLPEFFGDFIVVNGKAWPKLEVEPRKYRFRLLNGSDSRAYTLSLPGEQFIQIGTEGGLLNAPVMLSKLTLMPGERADVVLDFSRKFGQTLILRNSAKTPFPSGETNNPQTTGQIMALSVTKPLSGPDTSVVPASLRAAPIPTLVPDNTRELLLFEGTDEFGRLRPQLGTPDEGAMMWDDPITENPALNSTEVWEIYNATEDAHPIHLHLVTFQIVSRQKFSADVDEENGALSNIRLIGRPTPPPANEAGWKDTAQMFPGEVTRIVAKFDRPGLYVWHCHILSHEDHEMMRPFFVGEMPESVPAVTGIAMTANAPDMTSPFSVTPISALLEHDSPQSIEDLVSAA